MKLIAQQGEPRRLLFFCPGCNHGHEITVNGLKNEGGHTWSWNGSMDRPTFTPSLLITGVCHSLISNGFIQFLGDSAHALKNQTVEIPEWEKA